MDYKQKFSGVSGEAVERATGRDWDEWLAFLDGLGARSMNHKEIVALIAGPGELSNGWWQQSVAVGYEQARGLRVIGQTSGAGFQIGVQKTLPVSVDKAWSLLVEGQGRDAWLGKTGPMKFRKGETYTAPDGRWGEVRSAVAGQRIRVTWCSPELEQPSTLQVYLLPSGENTSVRFHQERLSNMDERERMRTHWRETLERLLALTRQPEPGD